MDGSFEIDYGIPIPLAQSQQTSLKSQPGVIFVLERASLEVAKVGKTYQLLNSDHSVFLSKMGKTKGDYRPDIVHQALLAILDSPLNKAGRLKGLYIRTEKGVLIEVKPKTHLPRTSKRFYGLMSQLLQKLSIKDEKTHTKLLRVIKNPVTQYLHVNSHKIGFSSSSEKLIKMKDYVHKFESDRDIVFVVGVMAHGKIEPDYHIDDFIADGVIFQKANRLGFDMVARDSGGVVIEIRKVVVVLFVEAMGLREALSWIKTKE
uniref:Ribosomal RNA small subunit methyltransferase NEP1 n=1 Tax=Cannabis sativa TaxID=3483 RepID=A0A803PVW8_CANSA